MNGRNKKKKIRLKLTQDQVRDMMANKLRAKTIQSSKLYKRTRNKHLYYDD